MNPVREPPRSKPSDGSAEPISCALSDYGLPTGGHHWSRANLATSPEPRHVIEMPVTWTYHFACILDVMGQSAHLLNLQSMVEEHLQRHPDRTQMPPEISALQEQTVGFVARLREAVLSTMTLGPNEIHVRFIGDAVALHAQVSRPASASEFLNDLHIILTIVSACIIMSLADGHALRGGMDCGVAATFEGEVCYGTLFKSTLEIEERVADYARIVVGPTLSRLLDAAAASTGDPGTRQSRLRELAQRCRELIRTDADGHCVVHWLGLTPDRVPPDVLEARTRAIAFARAELGAYEPGGARPNEKLAGKYRRLVNYIDTVGAR